MSSRFAAVRVTPASRDWKQSSPQAVERLLVDTAKLRWRIERDDEDLKSELGLPHFEGRGWRGLHHHATLCMAAYGFLIRERAAFPPQSPASAKRLPPDRPNPEAPPIRPERHAKNAIATIRPRPTRWPKRCGDVRAAKHAK